MRINISTIHYYSLSVNYTLAIYISKMDLVACYLLLVVAISIFEINSDAMQFKRTMFG